MTTDHPHRNPMGRYSWLAATLAVMVIVAIMSRRREATPSPLTPQETRDVITAIGRIAPGSRVANLRREPDGQVRAFLPGDPLGGQIVVVTYDRDVWQASVEMEMF